MPSPSHKIAVIGSLNVDFVTRTPRLPSAGETLQAESFTTGFGGKGANQAVAAARLSASRPGSGVATSTTTATATAADAAMTTPSVAMVGSVGEDSFGADMLAYLSAQGVDCTAVRRLQGHGTGVANIIVDAASGENRIMLAPNANHADGDRVRDLVPDDASVVVFQLEIPLEQVVHNIKLAKAKGKYVIFNPAPAQALPKDLLSHVDCLIVNESEANILLGRPPDEYILHRTMPPMDLIYEGVRDMVIMTVGEHGAYYAALSKQDRRSYRKRGRVHGVKVEAVDTTAAGDTFVGAVAARVAANGGDSPEDPHDLLELANRAAALTVQKHGAMSSIPWLDQVD